MLCALPTLLNALLDTKVLRGRPLSRSRPFSCGGASGRTKKRFETSRGRHRCLLADRGHARRERNPYGGAEQARIRGCRFRRNMSTRCSTGPVSSFRQTGEIVSARRALRLLEQRRRDCHRASPDCYGPCLSSPATRILRHDGTSHRDRRSISSRPRCGLAAESRVSPRTPQWGGRCGRVPTRAREGVMAWIVPRAEQFLLSGLRAFRAGNSPSNPARVEFAKSSRKLWWESPSGARAVAPR